MAEQSPESFAELLRRLRVAAGLTQEQLADSAKVSVRSISDLERGINLTARRETARLLASALHLNGQERAEFEAAARLGTAAVAWDTRTRTPRPDAGIAAATRTLPRDVGSFTGRDAELAQLVASSARPMNAGDTVVIYAVGGMAGVGKTALAVHAAHQLAPGFPDGQIFLPLHGHSPGQAPIEPEQALASLLQSAGVAVEHIPQGLETRVRLWRDYLAGRRFLIVLDDAVGHDQVRPLLPGTAGSLVLITSRRHLTALEDAHAISLDVLPPAEASELMVKLARRADIDATDPAVAELTASCGYLPLAIGMLAGQLHHHPSWTVRGLAERVAAAQDRLGLMHAENISVAAAFDLSYHDLAPGPQRLFRRLGLHPGTNLDTYAAAALDNRDLEVTQRHLGDLYDHYLIDEPSSGRYLIHDLLGAHARALSAADPREDRRQAVERLLGYYLHAASEASRHLASRPRAGPAIQSNHRPAHTPDLSAILDAIGWLDAERVNLYAVTMYAANAHPSYAIAIPAVIHGYLRHLGRWDQVVTLHDAAIQAAARTRDRCAEANALTDLGDIQLLSNNLAAAIASLTRAVEMHSEQGNSCGEANALAILGYARHLAGHHTTAAGDLTRALELHRANRDQLGEAGTLAYLGLLQHQTGDYTAATESLTVSLELHRGVGNRLGEAQALNAIGELALTATATALARDWFTEALRIAREISSDPDEAQALEGIGRCHQSDGEITTARGLLSQALEIYRRIGSPHADRVSALLES